MNILAHINSGHYPKDEKGRALVPCNGHGGTTPLITIYATDHGTSFPICGRHPDCSDAETYTSEGVNLDGNGDLLPPPPRKVQMEGWAVVNIEHPAGKATIAWSRDNLICDAGPDPDGTRYRVVRLTGEYEEPWE